MKVAMVGSRDGADPEGAVDSYVDELSAALSARGDDVTLYTRRAGGPRRSERGYAVAEVRVGPAKPLASSDLLPFVGDFAASLNSMWSADPPQVVHAHGWLAGLAAQLGARHSHLPVVQSFHGLARSGDDTPGTERQRLEPLLAKNATWVAAGFAAELDALVKVRHSRERISVVPEGVDIDLFSPVGPSSVRQRPYRMLYIGSNTLSGSGFDDIVRVMPRLHDSELLIAAPAVPHEPHGDIHIPVRRLANELSVGDRVHPLGAVSRDQLPALMRSVDVVVWTPNSAPTASIALQAMASGAAVVATGVDAIADVVVHAVTGLLITPGRQRELAGALKTLRDQQFQCQGMGAAGRARVRSRYTWDRVAADCQVIYHKIGIGSQVADVNSATG